jgi:membrane fusion protein, multidrug efflux system
MTVLKLASGAVCTLALASVLLGSACATAAPAQVQTATVETVRTADPLVFDGRVQALRHADVSNRIDGVIDAIHFSVGQDVERGDPLFELAPESYEAAVLAARAELGRAEAKLQQKQFVLDQQSRLRSKGVASELRYQEASNDAAITRAEIAAAQAALQIAELELSRTKIVAPIGGRIGEPLVALGSFVEAESGKPLAKIVQLDPIQVVYEVPYEQRLQTLSQTGGKSVEALLDRVTVRLGLPGGDLYPQSARPTFSSAEIDPLTGMLEVAATFPNPELVLLPGLPVRVTSQVEGVQQILSAIPREAARTDEHGLHVFVVQPSGLVERRQISLFRADNDRLLVGGVLAGEIVITDAEFQFGPGVVVTPKSAGTQLPSRQN